MYRPDTVTGSPLTMRMALLAACMSSSAGIRQIISATAPALTRCIPPNRLRSDSVSSAGFLRAMSRSAALTMPSRVSISRSEGSTRMESAPLLLSTAIHKSVYRFPRSAMTCRASGLLSSYEPTPTPPPAVRAMPNQPGYSVREAMPSRLNSALAVRVMPKVATPPTIIMPLRKIPHSAGARMPRRPWVANPQSATRPATNAARIASEQMTATFGFIWGSAASDVPGGAAGATYDDDHDRRQAGELGGRAEETAARIL